MKKLIIKLKTTFLYHDLLNHFYLLVLPIIPLILFWDTWYYLYLVLMVIILIFIWRTFPRIFYINLIIILIIIINLVLRNAIYKASPKVIENLTMEVIRVNPKENKDQILLRYKTNYYLTYCDKKMTLTSGTQVKISGVFQEASSEHTPGGFNYQLYLKNHSISGIINEAKIEVVKRMIGLYTINEKVNNYFNNTYQNMSVEARSTLKALVIGNKNEITDEAKKEIQTLGIGHLFVISGLHMGIIVLIISFILNKIGLNKTIQELIIIVIIVLYFIITGYIISLLRILITRIIQLINQKFTLHLMPLDCYMINIILVLLINPLLLKQIGAVLTYLTSITIIVISKLFIKGKGFKAIILNSLIISLASVLVTLPLIITISPQINILTIIYNLFYIPLVTYLILPFSIVVTIIPLLCPVYEILITIFTSITIFFGQINFGCIIFPGNNLPINEIKVIYYLLIILIYVFIRYRLFKSLIKTCIILIIILFLWNEACYFNFPKRVYFLDLPVGESILVKDSFNQTNILIDTGEKGYTDLIIFLQNEGIKRLDALFITHGDSDHIGLIEEVINKFKVKKLFISEYDEQTIKILKKIQVNNPPVITKLARGDNLTIGEITFKVIWPKTKSLSSNNNSLVMIMKAFNKTYLLTGDIEKEVEQTLINLEHQITVDILKIAHHGSSTSSSKDFLNHCNYQLAIGMNGYQNTFEFPHYQTIQNINNRPYYFTGDIKTIVIE